jgi:AcrR family transcriptional regulator
VSSGNEQPAVDRSTTGGREVAAGSGDRRVRRTESAIRAAFESLIAEKGYSAVTIQDILERADVGRSTFYAHYRDKEDLLTKGFDDVRASLTTPHHVGEAGRPQAGGLLAPTLAIFEHVEQYRHTWKPLVLKGGADIVTRVLRDTTEDLIRRDLQQHSPTSPQLEPATQFLAAGLMGLLTWWLDSQHPATAQDVHAMFVRFAKRGVPSVLTEPKES